jgi:Ca-activated chloride channel family protein
MISLFFLIIALARPQYGAKTVFVSKKASTIVIVMDASKSMLAQDLKPNRLEKAKSVLSNLIASCKGNKIGVISFAGTAFWQCPITSDIYSANNFLESIDVDNMPLGGTKISKALDLAIDGTAEVPEGAKAIILVTDGEDDESGLQVLIEKARKYKTKIYCIGIGEKNGSKIIYNNKYLEDKDGNVVVTKLDEDTLQYIADCTEGQYINLSESEDSVFKILKIVDSLDKAKDDASKEIQRDEKYQFFLFVSLMAFCCYLFLSLLKRQEGRKQ